MSGHTALNHGAIRLKLLMHLIVTSALLFSLVACSGAQGPSTGSHALEPAWTAIDIGNVGLPGITDVAIDRDEVRIQGAGQDVYGTEDSFHMAASEWSGDGEIVTRIDHVDLVNEWTKAGIMIRDSVAPNAPNVFIFLSPTNGTAMQARVAVGETTIEPGWSRAPRAPYWLKLARSGDRFTGYQSQDGIHWEEVGAVTVAMPSTVLVGMAVASQDTSTRALAVFENTRVSGFGRSPTEPERPVAGTPNPGTPVTAPTPKPAPAPGGERTSQTYSTDNTDFPNPERGWYVETPSDAYQRAVADNGFRLALKYVNLQDYRSSHTLPSGVLSQLDADFGYARQAGIKVALRIAYNRSDAPDAPIDVVLSHLQQLGPVIQRNSDVIAVVQGGIIGAYGEWWGSTNNLTSFENRNRIVEALLEQVPDSRMVQIRTPSFARDASPSEPNGTQRTFDGSDASRVALWNDCFLTSESDLGTFESQEDRDYFARVSRYVAIGGETCRAVGLVERNDCPTSLNELTRYHWDYLNSEFYRPIIDRWIDRGCYHEISTRLGYRFELAQVNMPANLIQGMGLDMTITMSNTGFGKLYNPRPIQVLLVPTGGGAPVVIDAVLDARTTMPLAGETTTFTLETEVSSSVPTGSYFVQLRLPDAEPGLQNNPNYSIRLANQGVWNAQLGANDLGLWVNVRSQ